MLRMSTDQRLDWREKAAEYGFGFHTMYGEPYWDESVYYQFTLAQIENDIEDPTEEIHQMCLNVVEKVIHSEELMARFCIPQQYWEWIRDSWLNGDRSLYSRLDLAYSGNGPAKLYENNADTPTSLYESGFWQWLWLEEKVKGGALMRSSDQFNSLQDQLVARFHTLKADMKTDTLHVSCCKDTDEDRGTVQYLRDCAAEAGIKTKFVYVEDIGLGINGEFTDLDNEVITTMFKLYPWEFAFREEYGAALPDAGVTWFEPPWKAILSNKAMLPLLWKLFPNHPNLLPSFFEDDLGSSALTSFVRKPIFAREGANVSIHVDGEVLETSGGPYGEEGFIYQAYHPLPAFGDNFTLIGSWLVNDKPAGISVREDTSRITQDLSRYIPHIILN